MIDRLTDAAQGNELVCIYGTQDKLLLCDKFLDDRQIYHSILMLLVSIMGNST